MAAVTGSVTNLARALEKLNGTVLIVGDGSIKGLLAGGLLIQRRSQKRTPVEYGFLRGSAFTRRAQDDPRYVEIGYGALYARAVHDKTEMKLRGKRRPSGLGTYWNPGEAEFLRTSYYESLDEVRKLVIKFSKVKAR